MNIHELFHRIILMSSFYLCLCPSVLLIHFVLVTMCWSCSVIVWCSWPSAILLFELQVLVIMTDWPFADATDLKELHLQRSFLVTGAAGFIGFHLARKLSADKANLVVGIDNFNNYYDVSLKIVSFKWVFLRLSL